MKLIKKSILIFMLILSVLSLMACGEGPNSTVDKFFTAVKANDFDTMSQLMDHSSGAGNFNFSNLSTDQVKIVKNILANTKADIVSSNVNGDNATVKVKLESADTVKIFNQVVANMMQNALVYANLPQDQIQQQALQSFSNAVSDPNAPKITSNIDLQLKKIKGQWEIEGSPDLANAITGNFSKAFPQYSGGSNN